jgi:hypothetical protein
MKTMHFAKMAFSLALIAGPWAIEPVMAAQAGADVSVQTKSRTERTTTGSGAQSDRGPNFRPHGWSEGRKKGWDCKVGSRNCKPPGLR